VSRIIYCYVEFRYAECRYTECRGALCREALIAMITTSHKRVFQEKRSSLFSFVPEKKKFYTIDIWPQTTILILTSRSFRSSLNRGKEVKRITFSPSDRYLYIHLCCTWQHCFYFIMFRHLCCKLPLPLTSY
jgi:hypothetical protein